MSKAATYDGMMALGARCNVCPLRTEGVGPCASEIIPGTDRIAIAQEPGKNEMLAQRPLAGRAGQYLDGALIRLGTSRHHLSTTHLVACVPPGGDMQAYEAKLRVRNKQRNAAGLPATPTPTECCAPRAHREAAPFLNVIPLGSQPARHFIPKMRGGILKSRGRLVEIPSAAVDPRGFFTPSAWLMLAAEGLDPARVPGRRLLPMLSPSYVMRYSEYDRVFAADLDRAWRWWSGRLRVYDTKMLFRPEIADIEHILLRRLHPDYQPMNWRGWPTVVHDWETDGIHAMTANPRCLGIGTVDWSVIVPYQPVQWRRESEARAIKAAQLRKDWMIADQNLDIITAIAAAHYEVLRDPPGDYDDCYRMDDGTTRPLYDRYEQAERDRILQHVLTDETLLKCGWNSGSYDHIVTKRVLGVVTGPHMDLILVKRSVLPELKHDLGTAGSIYCDLHDWKGGKIATQARTDETLGIYCGWDNVAPADMLDPMYTELEQRQTVPLLHLDHKMQSACVGMHEQGMLVDQEERERLDAFLASPGPARVRSAKGGMVDLPRGLIHSWVLRSRMVLQSAGVDVSGVVKRTRKEDYEREEWLRNAEIEEREDEDIDASDDLADRGFLPAAHELSLDTLAFNPMSHPQLRAVLFDVWDLPLPTDLKPKELYTSSGEISTGDAVIRRLMIDPLLSPEQRAFFHAVRMTRRHGKVWGTYVRPLRLPVGDIVLDRGCRVWSDGRVHASWNSHTPVTGRFSSSGPNVQNQPLIAKAMMVAGDGNVLVTTDEDQIEFRIAAALWKAQNFLQAFANGIDPYQITMANVFGGKEALAGYAGAPSVFGKKDFAKGSHFERMRKLGKGIQLASQYAAGCAAREGRIDVVDTQTVFRMVTSAEDKDRGVLLFPELTESDVASMHGAWLEGCAEYPQGWLNDLADVQQYGCLYEPVSGRRRDFEGQRAQKLNEIVNFKIQAAAAAIMNIILAEMVDLVPFGCWGPGTGIINQCHDSITIECPEAVAVEVRALMERLMNREIAALPGVVFTAEANIGWREKDPMQRGQSRWSET